MSKLGARVRLQDTNNTLDGVRKLLREKRVTLDEARPVLVALENKALELYKLLAGETK